MRVIGDYYYTCDHCGNKIYTHERFYIKGGKLYHSNCFWGIFYLRLAG